MAIEAVSDIVKDGVSAFSSGSGGAITGFVVPFTGTGASQNVTIPAASSASELLVFFGPARQLSNSYTSIGTTVNVTAPSGVGCEIVKLPGFKGDTGATGANGTNGTNGTADAVGEYSNGSNPTSPSTGLRLFARKNAGRNRLAYIGPAGIDVSVQAFLGANKVGYWGAQGNSNTAFNTAAPGLMLFNFGHAATGTATARAVATTNLFTSSRRLGFLSSGTVGNSAGTRHNALQFWTGNAAGLGGFEYVARFGISQVNATTRFFVGMSTSAAVIANSEPMNNAALLGFGANMSQTTMRVWSGGGTAVDLGANFPVKTQNSDLYEVRIFCPPNTGSAGNIYWSVTRLNTGHYSEGVFDSLYTPSGLLSPQIWINNGTTASAVAIDVISQYIETDV